MFYQCRILLQFSEKYISDFKLTLKFCFRSFRLGYMSLTLYFQIKYYQMWCLIKEKHSIEQLLNSLINLSKNLKSSAFVQSYFVHSGKNDWLNCWNVATYSYMGSGECKKGVSAKTRLSSYEIWCRKMYAPSSVNSMNDFWFCNGERLFRNGICWFCIKVCWFWFTLVCFVFQKVFQN